MTLCPTPSLEPEEMEPGGTTGPSEAPVQFKGVQIPAKCLGSTTVQPSAEGAVKVDQHGVTKVVSAVRPQQPASSGVSLSGLQTSPSVVVITKVAAPATNRQPQLRKAVLSQVAPLYQGPSPVRTVMITVPTPAAAHTAAVSHRVAAPTSQSPQLPSNIHIPPGERFKFQSETRTLFTMELFLDQGFFFFMVLSWFLTNCQQFDTNFGFHGFPLSS